MRDLDALAFYDALPPEERAALEAALRERPALAEAFARWQSLRAHVRRDLARDLPDRALLVLYALADDDLLSDAERERLEAARPELDAALEAHPGLVAAVRRIQADRDAFEAAWAEAAEPGASTADGEARDGASRPTIRTIPFDREAREPRRASRPAAHAADRPAARRPRGARPTRWAFRAAALAAVVAFAALLTTLYLRDAGWDAVDGAQTVTLADGSTVQLDEGARLEVSDGREARLLAGRALFRVERDEAQPFSVTTPNAEVVVLGTTFSVEATDVETEVALVEGAVTLAPRATPAAAVRLAPGQRSRVLALDAPTAPERADLGTLAWTGTVFSADLTAGQIARHLEAIFEVPVQVAPGLAAEPVAGEFGRYGLDNALEVLAASVGGEVLADGGGYRIAD